MCVYANLSDKDGTFRERRDAQSTQTGRPTDDSQQYSTDQLKVRNELREGLDTQTGD